MFKSLQRPSQTNGRKSEASHGIQGLPHSSSLNDLPSYHRCQRTWKSICCQTHPSLPSFRAFAHDISSAWSALSSPVPPVEIHFFPRKPVNRRRALALRPKTTVLSLLPAPKLPPSVDAGLQLADTGVCSFAALARLAWSQNTTSAPAFPPLGRQGRGGRRRGASRRGAPSPPSSGHLLGRPPGTYFGRSAPKPAGRGTPRRAGCPPAPATRD